VVQELAELRGYFVGLPADAAAVASTVLSSIIVSVSKQDSDTRYVRREKRIQPGDTVKRFTRALQVAREKAVEFAEATEPRFTCRVLHSDVLDRPDIGEVDLVVTSPPYPNAFSYHLYHRTRMLWLGMDCNTFKAREIGSHRKYSRRGPAGADEDTFRNELSSIFSWLAGQLKKGKYACFVVGDSLVRGKVVHNDKLMSDVAAAHGFILQASIERTLQANRKAFNPQIGNIKKEHILIFRNSRGKS